MMSGNVCLAVQSYHLQSKCILHEIRNKLLLLTSSILNLLYWYFLLRSPIGGSYTSDVQPSPSHSIEGPTDMSYIHCKHCNKKGNLEN